MSGVGFGLGVSVGWLVGSASWFPDGIGSGSGLTSTEISSCWSDGDLS
jgi:hypothetical protein